MMKKTTEQFEYTVKKSPRARRIRITIFRDGRVVVTVPYRYPEHLAEKFVREKSNWIIKRLGYFAAHRRGMITLKGEKSFAEAKREAAEILAERVEYFAGIYGFSYKKITVKNLRSRFGSCSKARNLNFNYKIIYLPPKMRDYIVVHEICHLKEMNHGRR